MKKLIALTLCVILFLTLLTGCDLFGSGGDGLGNIAVVGKTPSETGDDPKSETTEIIIQDGKMELSLNKTEYEPGEEINITVSGNITDQMIENYAFLATFKEGDGHNSGIGYENLAKGASRYKMTAPDSAGSYEVRLFKNASSSSESFVTSAKFTVTGKSISFDPKSKENSRLFGVWRIADEDGNVMLYKFNNDGTFAQDIRYTDGSADLSTGKYNYDADNIYILYDITKNGEYVGGEYPFNIEISGDDMTIEGVWCVRVPDEYVSEVLADPLAPYPPGSTNNVIDIDPDGFVGLWRNSDDSGNVALYQYKKDGSFKNMVVYSDKNTDNIVVTGKYRIEGDQVILSNRSINGKKEAGEYSMYVELYGDEINFNGEYCKRVPEEYVDAVLADPLAPYPPKSNDKDKDKTTGTPGERGSLTADIFATMESGKWHIKMKNMSGDDTESVVEMYLKDGQTSMIINSADGSTMRIISGNGKSYMIFDADKMIIASELDSDDSDTPYVGDITNLSYIGEGSDKFGGKTCKYDEYADDSGVHYLYFVDGKTFKGVRTISDGETSEVEILAFDKNIKSGVFDLPDDYEVMSWADLLG